MPRVLITAFKPYDTWTTNASWLAVVEMARSLPAEPQVTTRLYPVDYGAVREMLAHDLADNYDYALHLGQAPGSGRLAFEMFAVNVAGEPGRPPETYPPLLTEGPPAYRTTLPLAEWAEKLRAAGVPAALSFHAGTYLCNGVYYLSRHLATRMSLKTQAAFIHLPLDPSQTVGQARDLASLPAALTARGLSLLLEELR